jgi:hypothetical protein
LVSVNVYKHVLKITITKNNINVKNTIRSSWNAIIPSAIGAAGV